MDGRHDQEKAKSGNEGEAERKGAANRKALDSIPPPGTDPLHEGP